MMLSQALMNEAQRLGAINRPMVYPIVPKANIKSLKPLSKSIIAAAKRLTFRSFPKPAGYDPKAIKYQNSEGFFPDPWTGTGGVHDGQSYEIARFKVKTNEVGIIRGIWQYVASIGAPSNIVSLASPYDPCWGDTYAGAPIDIRWYFTLSQNPPIDYWDGASIGRPGTPYVDLPVLNRLSFPWGCPPSMFLVVQSGFTLRMFVEAMTNTSNLDRIGGRMWGYTQPDHSDPAIHNVRHGWT